jgi:hypothetical protein
MPSLSVKQREIVKRADKKYRTKTRILKGGVPRIVHVVAKVLRQNMDTGSDKPMIGVRRSVNPEEVTLYRHVEMLGPSVLFHTPDDPLPDTDGRGICYIQTTAALRVYVDAR